jgi:hypothetical protein
LEVGFFSFFFKNDGQEENQAVLIYSLIFDFLKLSFFNAFEQK